MPEDKEIQLHPFRLYYPRLNEDEPTRTLEINIPCRYDKEIEATGEDCWTVTRELI